MNNKYEITFQLTNKNKFHGMGKVVKKQYNTKAEANRVIDLMASNAHNVMTINAFIKEVA